MGMIFDGERGLVFDAGEPLLFDFEPAAPREGDRVAAAKARIDREIAEARARGVDVDAAIRQRDADFAAGYAAAACGGESVYAQRSAAVFAGGSR
jgi:hypothetical protein